MRRSVAVTLRRGTLLFCPYVGYWLIDDPEEELRYWQRTAAMPIIDTIECMRFLAARPLPFGGDPARVIALDGGSGV